MYYYHVDGLGSIVALTNASGSVAQAYTYDSFGNITSGAPTITQPYTYTGREYDPETGLYFYRARYYDPKAGRFITKDPIGFDGGDYNLYVYVDSVGKPFIETNLFIYAGNNPVNYADPMGLMWWGNWCGPGGSGKPRDCIDEACKRHDECYDRCGIKEGLDRFNRKNIRNTCIAKCDAAVVSEIMNCSCENGCCVF